MDSPFPTRTSSAQEMVTVTTCRAGLLGNWQALVATSLIEPFYLGDVALPLTSKPNPSAMTRKSRYLLFCTTCNAATSVRVLHLIRQTIRSRSRVLRCCGIRQADPLPSWKFLST